MNPQLPGLDLARLRSHIESVSPGLTAGVLSGELIEGGRSNLTYLVTDGQRQWVVRRPPLGHVLATAHDMSREYRVITALADTDVPVPGTELICTDEEVIGAQFYVMDYVPGTVYRNADVIEPLTLPQRNDLALNMVDVLARLHSLDPESVGLGDFGRPEGFLERQLRRWSKQLEASRSREIEGINELALRLARNVPNSRRTSIVHGDYRLDNVIAGEDGSIHAVLDWEMATLGDPLTDLGLLAVYWDGLNAIENNPIAKGVGPDNGFPSTSELFARYSRSSRCDLSELDWYVAFGFFKLAVIVEGIHYRFTQNQTVGAGFEQVGSMVPTLVAQGLKAL